MNQLCGVGGLQAYDFSVMDIPDGSGQSGQGDDSVSSEGDSDEDDMADFFRETLCGIAKTMDSSFCDEGTFPWLQSASVSPDERQLIPAVLAMVFGTWCVSGGVRRLNEPRDRVNVYLPFVLADGKTSCERGETKVGALNV